MSNFNEDVFLKIKQEFLPDVNGEGILFEHKKSGAKLFYLKTKDKNKVFFISFKTPPQDDCGTAHILEHSVLCGSQKYEAKDPFNELNKGSLNTYLNALTYADKTMYPIASCNNKDFQNLMDVYLDAVFHPLIFNRKEIFMQEGWHYELETKESPLTINGVVYNEMKGALSDPERLLGNCISKSLFPHSIYRFESGGNPSMIPELDYEKFLNFHKTFYHPSNCYLYLYGDMDIEERLDFLDKEYLSKFDRLDIKNKIEEETQFIQTVFLEDTYPVMKKEENDCFLSYNAVIGKSTDAELSLAFDILSYILLGTNASPLKKKLMEEKMGEEVEGWFDSSSFEMVFSIVAKRVKEEKTEQFRDIILSTLKELVEKGLNQSLVEACFNIWEFHLREEDYGYRPKGLVYGMKLMKSWLHTEDPTCYLKHWGIFQKIKMAAKEGYFETLIQEKLICNQHSSFVTMKAEVGKQEKIEKKRKNILKKKKEEMSQEQIEKIKKETIALKQYQSEQDSPEILAQIPLLELHEIDKKVDFQKTFQESNILFTPLKTNGVLYLQLLFDANKVPSNLIPYIGLLSEVFGKLDTKKYNYEELSTQWNTWTGGLGSYCDAYGDENGESIPKLIVSTKIMERNLNRVLELILEAIDNTVYHHYEHLRMILKETKSRLDNNIIQNAHSIAALKCLSYLNLGSQWKEMTSGIVFSKFLGELDRNFEREKEAIAEKLMAVAGCIFTKGNLTIGISMEEQNYEEKKKELFTFSDRLKKEKLTMQNTLLLTGNRREGYFSTVPIQYNVKAADFKKLGFDYSGKMHVLKTVIDLEYLWNRVRVKGGAYGSGCVLKRNGNLYLYSYRDPNIRETIQSYNEIGHFLENLHLSERELRKYIIGTISSLDQPLTNKKKADRAIIRNICNITQEKLQKERDALLAITERELKEYAELFQKAMAENYLCTIGNSEKIKECQDLYENLYSLLD